MKVLSYHDGHVTNSEVYSIVRKRREDKIHKKGIEYAGRNWIDHKVVQYCEATGQLQQVDELKGYISAVQALDFNLSQEEMIQLLNLRPKQPVDIFLIVNDCSERFSDDQVDELLQALSGHDDAVVEAEAQDATPGDRILEL